MYGNHRDLHRLTHSFPRRRASDLRRRRRRTCGPGASGARLGDDHEGLHAGHSRQPELGLRHGPPEGASMTHDLGKYAGPSDADSLYDAFSGWAEQKGRPHYPHQDNAAIELLLGHTDIMTTPTGAGK